MIASRACLRDRTQFEIRRHPFAEALDRDGQRTEMTAPAATRTDNQGALAAFQGGRRQYFPAKDNPSVTLRAFLSKRGLRSNFKMFLNAVNLTPSNATV